MQSPDAAFGGRLTDSQRHYSFRHAAAIGSLKTSLSPVDQHAMTPIASRTSSSDSPAAPPPTKQSADDELSLTETQHLALQEMRSLFAEVYSKEKVGSPFTRWQVD